MTLLGEISKSVSQMSDDELLERMRQLRGARRVTTPIGGTKTPKPKAAPKSTTKLIEAMSQDELAAMLAELEGEL